ncbi:DUF2487 family protein [Metabacillus arenae]|uniref:DUF2487 family protein n=1 Tax=Metabacillus arenae TaxID=2771434 RepID=A0A926NJ31_9BACI|nr:DUF2487 family protein [Metabacillus arenae]MBD1381690.1 DUF2487 family protein [Metabacillus arenae]
MKWTAADVEVFNQSKEYIDTVIIPILSVTGSRELKSTVSKGEFITQITQELERQLTGRIFLYPPLTFIKSDDHIENRLIEWKKELENQFKHVLFLTSEEKLKEDKDKSVIWIPAVPLEHLSEKLKGNLFQDQIEQILNILLQYWSKS